MAWGCVTHTAGWHAGIVRVCFLPRASREQVAHNVSDTACRPATMRRTFFLACIASSINIEGADYLLVRVSKVGRCCVCRHNIDSDSSTMMDIRCIYGSELNYAGNPQDLEQMVMHVRTYVR